MSGLQRRRVGASNSNNERVKPVTQEESHRVGYDPEDIDNQRESIAPRLTLMEEVLLLGLKDQQGYLSFWNDSTSYILRGCILQELALQGKIRMVNDPLRRRLPLSERVIELVDDRITGEVLLDETVKIMKQSEPLSVANWIDFLSGETWNISKISYQLKQVRERLSKGLVDKGILRTEKRNFFLFDMATHPVADSSAKDDLKRRIGNVLTSNSINVPTSSYSPETLPLRVIRTVVLIVSAYAANVLENALVSLSYSSRDAAFLRSDELLSDYSEYPFQKRTSGWASSLFEQVQNEIGDQGNEQLGLQLEVVAAVNRVYSQLDAVL